MRSIGCIVVCLFLLMSCNVKDIGDCFDASGRIINQDFTVGAFSRILVNRDVALILSEGQEHRVRVQTGENLMNDIDVKIIENQLVLTNNNTCNDVREAGVTKIFVTSPNITEIRSSTQFDIRSNGVLTYPNLTLLSEDFFDKDSFTVGDFRLEIDNNMLRVVFNNLSHCYVSGKTNSLNVQYASGDGRFEGANLWALNVFVNHRGTNDIIINPQESLRGRISSTGRVVLKNNPPLVDVDLIFKGKLILN